MSKMYGPGDPTKITSLPLSKEDVVLQARQICQTSMPVDWDWGFVPLSSTNPPTEEVRNCATRVVIPVTVVLWLTVFLFLFRLSSASLALLRISEALSGSGLWTRWTLTLTSIGPSSRWAARTLRAPVTSRLKLPAPSMISLCLR
jgi:hypothetical protein